MNAGHSIIGRLAALAAGLALVFAHALPASAQQQTRFGLTGGGALTTMSAPEIENGVDFLPGWTAGVYGVLPVGEIAALQAEVLYTRKGARELITLASVGQTIPRDYVVEYIEIPLLARGSLELGLPVTLLGFAGASPAVLVRAWNKVPDVPAEDMREQMRAVDLGLTAGAGAALELGFGTAQLNVRYTHGVLDTDSESMIGVNRNRSAAVMLGVEVENPF